MDNPPISYHIPALLEDTIERLDLKPDGIYVDCTFGGGGHSREILRHLGPNGRLFGFDRDLDALGNAPDDPRFTFVRSDFRYIRNFLHFHGVRAVDGILADLGVSFHHFDTPERGFSFRHDAPLDMRMNRKGELTAADLLASYSEQELDSLMRLYTDLKNTRSIAKAIISARSVQPVDTTFRLADAVEKSLNPKRAKKDLAQVFQALRIATNDELASLHALMEEAPALLKPGGRMAVLTYHSLEDRVVKNYFRSGNPDGKVETDLFGRSNCIWRTVGKNPTVPSEEEVERNPRARSAKLRAAERIGEVNQ